MPLEPLLLEACEHRRLVQHDRAFGRERTMRSAFLALVRHAVHDDHGRPRGRLEVPQPEPGTVAIQNEPSETTKATGAA